MTREDLDRWEAELTPLVPAAGASAVAREHSRELNRSVDDLRAALLEPARALLARGAPLGELPGCLQRAVAELSFWRRVLQGVHGAQLQPEPARPDGLLRYLMS
jgi:hypothetical protein